MQVVGRFEEALESDVDAVVIATPIRTHYELARQALEQGKHVLVEKPLTASSAEAEKLIALADSVGRVLMVGHTFMYNPAVETCCAVWCRKTTRSAMCSTSTPRADLGIFQPGINVMWDLAPHDISILCYILDRRHQRQRERRSLRPARAARRGPPDAQITKAALAQVHRAG